MRAIIAAMSAVALWSNGIGASNEVASVQVGRCRWIVRKSFEDYMARLIEESA